MNDRDSVLVWRLPVRVAHWLLATGFVVAYLTEGEDEVIGIHAWAGYLVAALVLWRVLMGLVGPADMRFSGFVRGPRAVLDYLLGLLRRTAPRSLGHNPAGAAMIVLLLFSLAVTTGSGMALYAVRENSGPLAAWLYEPTPKVSPEATLQSGSASVEKKVKRRKPGREIKEVHELFANLSLFLVLLHIGGVVLSSLVHRENLPRSMITGRKRA